MLASEQLKKRKAIILIACGTAIATSTMVAEILKQDLVRTNHYRVEFGLCSVNELQSRVEMNKPDIVITTVSVPKAMIEKWEAMGINYFRGTPFITGIGDAPLREQIVALLDKWGVKGS